MKRYISEIIITFLLVIFSGLLWNPYWMPMGLMYALLVCFVVVLGSFSAFVWREQGGDERDVLIRHVASRFAYLAGAIILAAGIIYQALKGPNVDAWLIAAFIVTILAKAAGYAYGREKY